MNIIKDSLSLFYTDISRAVASPFLSAEPLSFCFCLRFRTCRGKCGVWPSWTCLHGWSCSRPWTLRSGQSRASRTSWTKSRPTTFPQNGTMLNLSFLKHLKTTSAKRQLTSHCVWSVNCRKLKAKTRNCWLRSSVWKRRRRSCGYGEVSTRGWMGAGDYHTAGRLCSKQTLGTRMCTETCIVARGSWICAQLWGSPVTRVSHPLMCWYCVLNNGCPVCPVTIGVKHQDSQNSFLAFLNAPTSALDQFDVSITQKIWLWARQVIQIHDFDSLLSIKMFSSLHYLFFHQFLFVFVFCFPHITSCHTRTLIPHPHLL